MATTSEPKPFNPLTDPYFGNIFFLDKFKGFQQYVGGIEWKSGLNRIVFLAVGSWPKSEKQTVPFDLDGALATLGYVKADSLDGLIEASRSAMMTVANQHPFPGSQECVNELTAALKAIPDALRLNSPAAEEARIEALPEDVGCVWGAL